MEEMEGGFCRAFVCSVSGSQKPGTVSKKQFRLKEQPPRFPPHASNFSHINYVEKAGTSAPRLGFRSCSFISMPEAPLIWVSKALAGRWLWLPPPPATQPFHPKPRILGLRLCSQALRFPSNGWQFSSSFSHTVAEIVREGLFVSFWKCRVWFWCWLFGCRCCCFVVEVRVQPPASHRPSLSQGRRKRRVVPTQQNLLLVRVWRAFIIYIS